METFQNQLELEQKLRKLEYSKRYQNVHRDTETICRKTVSETIAHLRSINPKCIKDECMREKIVMLQSKIPKRGRPCVFVLDPAIVEQYIKDHNVKFREESVTITEIEISPQLLEEFENAVKIKELKSQRDVRYQRKNPEKYKEYHRNYYANSKKSAESAPTT